MPGTDMSLDQAHLGVTFLLWVVGLIYISLTLPKVSTVRRVSYVLAVPVWLGWSLLYGIAFFSYQPVDSLAWSGVALRVLLFAIAMEGILVPFTDRLELKSRMQEIRLEPPQ